MPAKIEIERQDDVMIVTNDFPETRNALNADFCTGFADTLAKASEDPTIGAIVLTWGCSFLCGRGFEPITEVRYHARTGAARIRSPTSRHYKG